MRRVSTASALNPMGLSADGYWQFLEEGRRGVGELVEHVGDPDEVDVGVERRELGTGNVVRDVGPLRDRRGGTVAVLAEWAAAPGWDAERIAEAVHLQAGEVTEATRAASPAAALRGRAAPPAASEQTAPPGELTVGPLADRSSKPSAPSEAGKNG